MSDDGYLFGCCAACRAPIQPKTARNMAFPENQAVFYMIARFEQVAVSSGQKSAFTSTIERSHLVSRAKVGDAMRFCFELEASALDQALPGFAGNEYKEGKAFLKQKKQLRRAESNIIEEAKKAVDPTLSESQKTDQARALIEIISEAVTDDDSQNYKALWDAPQTFVRHEKLLEWLKNQGSTLKTRVIDFERTAACCTLCNDIWDCFGLLRQVFEASVIPQRCVLTKIGNKAAVELPAQGTLAQRTQGMLGALVAYYLHACLKTFKEGGLDDSVLTSHRGAILLLAWAPLHINCMFKSFAYAGGSTAGKPKGYHNYAGCLDLLISYYLYTLGCLEPVDDLNLSAVPFERFHVFYAKELPECPGGVWPLKAGLNRLDDFVFLKAEYDALGKVFADETSFVSDRLVTLYESVIRPLAPTITGKGAALPAASAFFLTHAEADSFVQDRLQDAARDYDNLRLHMTNAGVTAILWQLRRSLLRENESYRRELDRWLFARMRVEWKNIALNSESRMTLEQAQAVYLGKHTLALPAVAGAAAEEPVNRRCSVWKAAHRLRATHFTTPPALRRAYGSDEEEEDGSDEEPAQLRVSTLACSAAAVTGGSGSPGGGALGPGSSGRAVQLASAQRPSARLASAQRTACATAAGGAEPPARWFDWKAQKTRQRVRMLQRIE